jgi:hypothetical protein
LDICAPSLSMSYYTQAPTSNEQKSAPHINM